MTEFTTPTGRLVWGKPYELRTKTDRNNQPKIGKDGQPMQSCDIGVAFPKSDPATAGFIQTLRAADRAAWPQFHGSDGMPVRSDFADKITDGDSAVPNKKGKIPNQQEGYPGHWIVSFGSSFLPACYEWGLIPGGGGREGWVRTPEGKIKPGDYVIVGGSTVTNKSAESPGMYRNLNMVGLVSHGQPIVSAQRDPNEVLGAARPVAPAGSSTTPIAPAPMPAPAAPVAASTSGPAPSPTASAGNYTGFMDTPAPPPPAPPPAPTGPIMTAKAQQAGYTYDALKAGGWTDDQMRQHGYLA